MDTITTHLFASCLCRDKKNVKEKEKHAAVIFPDTISTGGPRTTPTTELEEHKEELKNLREKEKHAAVIYPDTISFGGPTTTPTTELEEHGVHNANQEEEESENQNQIGSEVADMVIDIAKDEAKSAAIEMAVTAAMEEYVIPALPETAGGAVAEEAIHSAVTAAIEEYVASTSIQMAGDAAIQGVTNAAVTAAIEEHATSVVVEIAATVALECLAEGAVPGVSTLRALIKTRRATKQIQNVTNNAFAPLSTDVWRPKRKTTKTDGVVKSIVRNELIHTVKKTTGLHDVGNTSCMPKVGPKVRRAATKTTVKAIGGLLNPGSSIGRKSKKTGRKLVGKVVKKMFNPF